MRISDPMVLKVGDVFYESDYGINYKMTVTKAPSFDNDQWRWEAKNSAGSEVGYLITKGFEHYGPRIYTFPAYTGEIR